MADQRRHDISAHPTPMSLLQWARREVPAVRYAVGAVGIAAAGALTLFLLGNIKTAAMAAGFVLIGMFLLFTFSRFSSSRSRQVIIAGIVMMWFIVGVFILSIALTLSSAATGWPPQWANLIGIEGSRLEDNIADTSKVVTLTDTAEGRRALQSLIQLGLSARADDVRNRVRDDFKTRLLDTGEIGQSEVVRAYRQRIMAALLEISNRDLTSVFSNDDMSAKEWVGMDLRGVKLAGMNLSGAFFLGSDLENADLQGANLTGAMLRGVDLRDAKLHATNWGGDADWFNAKDLWPDQFENGVLRTMAQCPKPGGGKDAVAALIARANDIYAVPFDQWRADESGAAKGFWYIYLQPKGLCERVAASNAQIDNSIRPIHKN